MAFVDWNEKYTVRDKELDEQHQCLFAIVNDLHAAIFAKRGKAEISRTFKRLSEYTQSHFATEERLMQACGYPHYQAHKDEHEKLLRKVAELDREFHKAESNIAPDVLAFLVKEWLSGHILRMDKGYAASISSHRPTASDKPPRLTPSP